jgi:penicillin-binding protein 2
MEIKNRDSERSIFFVRLNIVTMFLIVVLVCIMYRIFYLQVLNHEHYITRSQENRLKIQPLIPSRGLIYSSDGVLLAGNKPSFSLLVIPEKVADMPESILRLSKLIQLNTDGIGEKLRELKKAIVFQPVVLKNRLTEQEVAIFSANRVRFPDFFIKSSLIRDYPLSTDMAHVVGYVGKINARDLSEVDNSSYRGTRFIGKSGVEFQQEAILHGKAGYQKVEVNAEGRVLRIVERKEPIPGSNVYLTISSDMQKRAFEQLEGSTGAIVMLELESGRLLASASNPSFDPNLFIDGMTSLAYRKLINSPGKPLFNRVFQGQYPPGSVVKPFITIGALESEIVTTGTHVNCPGFYRLNDEGRNYHCWSKKGHGNVDLNSAIARSCDVYYYHLARNFGIDRIQESLRGFGFGSKTGVGFLGEKTGLLPSREWKKDTLGKSWFPGETLITGIGQGFILTTPIQLAQATAIFAQKGLVTVPRYLDYYEAPNGLQKDFDRELAGPDHLRLKHEEHWNIVRDAMVDVVHSDFGTARSSRLAGGIKFAGKTGTAQVSKVNRGSKDQKPIALRDHALFIGFAPAYKPEVVIAVVVENGGSGSGTAAPIAKSMLDAFFYNKFSATNIADE